MKTKQVTSLFHTVAKLIRFVPIMAAFCAFALYNVVGFVPTLQENIPYTVYYMRKKSKKTAINSQHSPQKPQNFVTIVLILFRSRIQEA